MYRSRDVVTSSPGHRYRDIHGGMLMHLTLHARTSRQALNPLESRGNYSATSNNMKLIHWPLISGLLRLVQRLTELLVVETR